MDGPEIFAFSLKRVPKTIQLLLQKVSLTLNDIDLFVFHQANGYMLEHLRKKTGIPKEKFCVALEETGNTVSSSIPLALKKEEELGKIFPGQRIMLVGYGVGYSWGATIITWGCS
jgi:3-oxoacyl-[acyl-carrier-protein] synthase-3